MKSKKGLQKIKVIIVGSFPRKNQKSQYGGMFTSCKVLLNSSFAEKFNIIPFNSTSFSAPIPNLVQRSFYAFIRLIKFIYKLIKKNPQIIIIFVAEAPSAIEKGLMILISKLFQKKIMVFPRAGKLINKYYEKTLIKKYINFTFSRADIFLSQGVSFQKFATRELKFPEKLAPIIPNWTANQEHITIGSFKDYMINISTTKILFLGYLEDYKGVNETLEAALKLKKKNYNFHLSFAGDGALKNYAINFVNKHNLKENISFLGWVDETRKIKLLKEYNIFLLPSWNEGFPNALIEAMSAGLACIVSSVGNIPDFLTNGHNCILIKPKSPVDIFKAIERLLKDKEFLRKISENGHLYAYSNFTADNGLKLLTEEIEKLSY